MVTASCSSIGEHLIFPRASRHRFGSTTTCARTHGRCRGIAVWSRVPLTMVVGQEAYGLSGNIVSDNYFDVLGVRSRRGRFFDADAGNQCR